MIGDHVGTLGTKQFLIRCHGPLNVAPATTARQKPLPSACPDVARPRALRELDPGPQRSLCRVVAQLGIEPMTTRCLVVALATKPVGPKNRCLFKVLRRRTGLGFACFASSQNRQQKREESQIFVRILPRYGFVRAPTPANKITHRALGVKLVSTPRGRCENGGISAMRRAGAPCFVHPPVERKTRPRFFAVKINGFCQF